MDSISNQILSQVSTINAIVAGLFTLLLTFLCHHFFRKPSNNNGNNKKLKAPEPAGARPIMGHIHLLRSCEQPHKMLAELAEKYGPIFSLKLGLTQAIVVSSWEVAKDCFTTNDKIFPSRPITAATRHLSYNFTLLGFAPYGPYWRELRKIVMTELLSNRRLKLLKHVWDSEIYASIKELFEEWKAKEAKGHVVVDMKQWFGNLTFNIGLKMVAGKRFFGSRVVCDEDESRRFQHGFREFFRLLGVFLIEDALPFLSWWDSQGYQKEMKKTASEMDNLIQGWLDEHKSRRSSGEDEGEKDFMDVMLNILEGSEIAGADADTVNKSTCLTLILGATDTTTMTLTWALSLLLNNRHVLKKAQQELDQQIGKHRLVDVSDINNLTYIHAILKEVLRLYPPAPLSGRREALEDCVVAGYHVPKGTRLMVNVWKIQRDPDTWPDPTEFRPERFLTTHKHVDVWGQNFELIPFGSGRRACPGISMALQVLPLALARVLQGFEIATVGDAPVDVTESKGVGTAKETPLEVAITPRLPAKFYE